MFTWDIVKSDIAVVHLTIFENIFRSFHHTMLILLMRIQKRNKTKVQHHKKWIGSGRASKRMSGSGSGFGTCWTLHFYKGGQFYITMGGQGSQQKQIWNQPTTNLKLMWGCWMWMGGHMLPLFPSNGHNVSGEHCTEHLTKNIAHKKTFMHFCGC